MRLSKTSIGDSAAVWTLGGETIPESYGANCTAISGSAATLLVDPLIAPAHARLVAEAVEAEGRPPVRWVVLTHHHTDHALGASYFARRGATVVAHEACRHAMAEAHPELIETRRRDPALAPLFEDAEMVPPTLTFFESLAIDLGGHEARIVHPGHGHTPGDAIVFVPSLSMAVCGDLVSNGYHVNFEDADLGGFEGGLSDLASLDARTCVPGHGAPGGKDIVHRQQSYLAAVRRLVTEGRAAGQSDDRIAASIRVAFPDYRLAIVLPDTVRRFAEAS